MILMDSIMASRGMALRAASVDYWPEGTVQTRDDVIFHGSSLVRVAREGHTPAVRIGPAARGWGRSTAVPQRFITVLLTRVEQIGYSAKTRLPEIWVDAELNHCQPIFSAARVIGRESSARHKRMHLRPQAGDDAGWVRLPADIVAGDLIVVPCDGTTPLSDVRRRAHHPERLSQDRTEASDDDFPYAPSCLK